MWKLNGTAWQVECYLIVIEFFYPAMELPGVPWKWINVLYLNFASLFQPSATIDCSMALLVWSTMGSTICILLFNKEKIVFDAMLEIFVILSFCLTAVLLSRISSGENSMNCRFVTIPGARKGACRRTLIDINHEWI